MEEIKVGEYGRTNLGKIFIFAWLEVNGKRVENKVILGDGQKITNEFYYFEKGEEIVKHSPNIIDLIEEGDFVNGYICKRIPNFDNEMCNFDLNLMQWIPLEDIDVWYNIVTKEQFDSRKYIVGDESNE